MKRRRSRGIILFTALVIAAIMMLWAVAATFQTNFQTSATRHSYRKSELYYLAKRATSRALNQLNLDPNWLATHTSLATADDSTPGTLCWVEPGSKAGTLMLRTKATIGNASDFLNVPILKESDTDIHIYSIAPAVNGGPDLIAWTTKTKADWESLPPIPGVTKILSTTQTPGGDIYAVGELGTGTGLWRYRKGQGWVQLPDPPSGVQLQSLSAGGNERLVCRGSDNSMMILPLGTDQSQPMQWKSVDPPTGLTLTNVAAHPGGNGEAYATGTGASGQVVYHYDVASDSWNQYPVPVASTFDPATGAPTGTGGPITDFSGGLVAGKDGSVYAASNSAGSASVVYAFKPDAPGSQTGTWSAVPPLPALEWQGDTVTSPAGYATQVEHLQVDDQGGLWAQSNAASGATQSFSIIRFQPPTQ